MRNLFMSCTVDQTLLVKLDRYGKTLFFLLPGSMFNRSSNTQFRKWKDSNNISKNHQGEAEVREVQQFFLALFPGMSENLV